MEQKGQNSIVLHLSDLHFGWTGEVASGDNRPLALTKLIQAVKKEGPEWLPNIICITGDIGWQGLKSDYSMAKKWILELLGELGVDSNNLFLCPGNHDSYRKDANTYVRPNNGKEADRVLELPIKGHYLQPFKSYIKFCEALEIPEYMIGGSGSYLVGGRKCENLNIICLNSAWFS